MSKVKETKAQYDKVMICPKCNHSLNTEATTFTVEDGAVKAEFHICENCGAYVAKDLVKEVFIKRAEPVVKNTKATISSLDAKLDKLMEMLEENNKPVVRTLTIEKERPLERPAFNQELGRRLSDRIIDFGNADFDVLARFFGL